MHFAHIFWRAIYGCKRAKSDQPKTATNTQALHFMTLRHQNRDVSQRDAKTVDICDHAAQATAIAVPSPETAERGQLPDVFEKETNRRTGPVHELCDHNRLYRMLDLAGTQTYNARDMNRCSTHKRPAWRAQRIIGPAL